MRLRDAGIAAAVACAVVAACGQPGIVKYEDVLRRDGQKVGPDYDFSAPRNGQRGKAARLLASSRQKSASGDIAGAVADAQAAQKADPAWSDPHTALGLMANQRGDAEAAGRHFARAAELAPNDSVTLGNYGAWLCAGGRPEESLDWLRQALARAHAPQLRADSLANFAACALKAGRADEAELAAREALTIDAGNAVALETLARHHYGSGRYFEARAFAERRIAAAPATPEVLRLASQIEQKLGDSVAATRYVQRLRTEFPQARIAGPGEAVTP